MNPSFFDFDSKPMTIRKGLQTLTNRNPMTKPLRYITKMFCDRFGDVVPVMLFPETFALEDGYRHLWTLQTWCPTNIVDGWTRHAAYCLDWQDAPADEEAKIVRQYRKEFGKEALLEGWQQIIKKIVKADKTAKEILLDEPEFFQGKVTYSTDHRAVWAGAAGGHDRGFILIGNKIEWFDVDAHWGPGIDTMIDTFRKLFDKKGWVPRGYEI
jgi:hypothetical protein